MTLPRPILLLFALLIAVSLLPLAACGTTQRLLTPVIEPVMPAALIRVPVPKDERVIVLTIDDAPSARTDDMLALLDRFGVRATFFIHTDQITNEATRAAMAAIAAAGHDIAHHMPKDRNYRDDSAAAFADAFARTDAALRAYPDAFQPYFRPPRGGYRPDRMDEPLTALGYDRPLSPDGPRRRYVMASFIPWDAKQGATDTPDLARNRRKGDQYVDQILGNLYPGAIVIFHDGIYPGREPRFDTSLGSLERFLVGLEARGFRAVPLSAANSLRDIETAGP